MKVKELIHELSSFDPELEAAVFLVKDKVCEITIIQKRDINTKTDEIAPEDSLQNRDFWSECKEVVLLF